MSKLNSKLFKSKMSENGITSEAGDGAGSSGFKMGNVVQQCVEVNTPFVIYVKAEVKKQNRLSIFSKTLTRARLLLKVKMALIS